VRLTLLLRQEEVVGVARYRSDLHVERVLETMDRSFREWLTAERDDLSAGLASRCGLLRGRARVSTVLRHLCQADPENPRKRYFARFGSISLNEREQRFSQPKLELYGLFRALRAYKIYIVGVRNLIIEVDAQYIRGMLNNPNTAPSASVNRWIVSILTFHFELRHVPGKIHGPDGLS